ncbi:MAG: Xaa-Pro peptidase family protein [Ignavibacteria bacterium]|nr:Xaa-Pro peptidase family protein [Ignavibacteria bacterium]
MNRIEAVKSNFKKLGVDSFLVENLSNIRYLSGFSGSAGALLLTKDKDYFISDFRYKSQSAVEVYKNFNVIIYKQNSYGYISDLAKKHGLKKIGFESNFLTFNDAENLKKEFAPVKFVGVNALIEKYTSQKNEREIELTKQAVAITDKVFSEMLGIIKPGLTEKEVSAEITYRQKKYGASGDSFDPIVASGERSAFPHARPTDRKIGKNELLTLDFGCIVEGMKSDMTRTIAIGKLPSECKKIYDIVLEAQKRAVDAVRAGIKVKKLDSYARGYIKEKGYGNNFGHGLGHGLGYDIHEGPSINPRTDYTLQVNNIVTIEPGIYVEGLGGVRIEDDVVVKEKGCEILNISPKELISL